MTPDFIIAVTEGTFEYEVLAYSQNKPVVVDFWADWCRPCKVLTPLLEKLAYESQGEFRLAKVDVDASPNLALMFSVRNIPTVIGFSQGKKVIEFTGVLPEARIREFLAQILPPPPSNLLAQKGNSLLYAGDIQEAEGAFKQALTLDDQHPGSLLGMLKVQLLRGEAQLAYQIYEKFPASPEFNKVETLVPLIKSMTSHLQGLLPADNDLDAAFTTSMRLAARGNLYASIDGLLDIIRQEKHYRKDKARDVLLGLLELLDPEAQQTRQYRSELATILF